MSMHKFKLSEEDTKRIEAAVKTAEARSSGEIVPVIAPASSDYLWVPLVWGLGMTGIATVLEFAWSARLHAWLTIYETVLGQLIAMALGLVLGSLPAVKRLTIPRRWRHERVKRSAYARFVTSGCVETRDRTGILIYLSLLEHEVQIIADKGINEKVGAAFWQKEADQIARGVQEGKAGEALVTVITEMADNLAKHFPRRSDDKNELPDKLQYD